MEQQPSSEAPLLIIPKNDDDEDGFRFPNFPHELIDQLTPALEKLSISSGSSGNESNEEMDVHKQLEVVMKENATLRATLEESAAAVKEPFAALCQWQEDSLKVFQNHKQRYLETEQHLQKLINEKMEMLKHMEILKGSYENEKSEKQTLQKLLQDTESRLNYYIVRENKRISLACTSKEKELSSIVEMLTKRLETAERAKRQLGFDLERCTVQKAKLERKFNERRGLYERENRLTDINALRHGAELLRDIHDVFALERDKYLYELQKKTEYNLDCTSASLELLPPDSETFDADPYIARLKYLLKHISIRYEELMTRYVKSYDDAMIIRPELIAPSEPPNPAEPESLDVLVAKVVSLEEEIMVKTDQIEHLSKRVKTLETENEAIPILKTQAFVYQSDFNIERKNREDLAAERDKLLADMRQILRENKHLAEQLQQYHPGSFGTKEAASLHAQESMPSSSLIMDQASTPVELTCPNPDCSMTFSTVEPLQIHVERCLKLTD